MDKLGLIQEAELTMPFYIIFTLSWIGVIFNTADNFTKCSLLRILTHGCILLIILLDSFELVILYVVISEAQTK